MEPPWATWQVLRATARLSGTPHEAHGTQLATWQVLRATARLKECLGMGEDGYTELQSVYDDALSAELGGHPVFGLLAVPTHDTTSSSVPCSLLSASCSGASVLRGASGAEDGHAASAACSLTAILRGTVGGGSIRAS